jgi:hypothetical protein
MKKALLMTIIFLKTILCFSQNVGIGTTTPKANLEIRGSGNSSATNNFMLSNSLGDTLLRMRNDGRMNIGFNGSTFGRTLNISGTGINFNSFQDILGGAIFPTDTSLVLWSNSLANNYLVLQPSWGNTGIGTYSPNAKLHVNGGILIGNNAQRSAAGYEMSVDGEVIAEGFTTLNSTAWPDYVFEKEYRLMPLSQLKEYIDTNKHLPNIPPAATIEKNGINLGEMVTKLTEKIEELTLHIIALDKKNTEVTIQLDALKNKN